jgi:hypothetical protein
VCDVIAPAMLYEVWRVECVRAQHPSFPMPPTVWYASPLPGPLPGTTYTFDGLIARFGEKCLRMQCGALGAPASGSGGARGHGGRGARGRGSRRETVIFEGRRRVVRRSPARSILVRGRLVALSTLRGHYRLER